MIISELIADASRQLENISDSPRLDAEVLLCHVLNKGRSYLLTWPDRELDAQTLNDFQQLLQQRAQGIPIAHLTGRREFWSLDLKVTPDTLIPRPETELLVEYILDHYSNDTKIRLADLGTGTGAIAIAIAAERPNWQLVATDISGNALEVARYNAGTHKLNNIEFRQGRWCEPLGKDNFDIIVSNPPYIPQADPHLQQGDVRFEPLSALASGEEGIDDIREIVHCSQLHLKPNGLLIIEHGYDQKSIMHDIFTKNTYHQINQLLDLANNPRATLGYKS